MASEPRRIHPVTFFDRQPHSAIEDGVADFRPNIQSVPLAARMGPPALPVFRPEAPEPVAEDATVVDPDEPDEDDTESDEADTALVKSGPAPD